MPPQRNSMNQCSSVTTSRVVSNWSVIKQYLRPSGNKASAAAKHTHELWTKRTRYVNNRVAYKHNSTISIARYNRHIVMH